MEGIYLRCLSLPRAFHCIHSTAMGVARVASCGWTELSECCVCIQECPVWVISVALSGVAVALEIEKWSCSRQRNDVSVCPFPLARWEPFGRGPFPRMLRKQRPGLFMFSRMVPILPGEKRACRHVVSLVTSV